MSETKDTEATAALHAALARAIAQTSSVAKDSKNKHFGYAYASSEDVIEESRGAMSEHGLALVPVLHKIHWPTAEDEARDIPAVVCIHYVLTHQGGAAMEVVSETPIIPEKGRPWDKALAASKTYDLAYTLRTLLLLPRGEGENSVDAREERGDRYQRPVQQRAPTKPQQSRPPQPPAPKAPTPVPPPAESAPSVAVDEEPPPHDDADAGPPHDDETPWGHAREAAAVKAAEAELGARIESVSPPKPTSIYAHAKAHGFRDPVKVDAIIEAQFGRAFKALAVEEKKQAAALIAAEGAKLRTQGAAIVRGARGGA